MSQAIPQRSVLLSESAVAPREVDPSRRRRLVHVVVAVVASCGIILVAAGISRMVRRDDDAGASVAPRIAPPSKASVAANPGAAGTSNAIGGLASAADSPATGTVRIEAPAVVGRVWIDSRRLISASTLLSCGKHQLRVGARDRGRSVDVPCGGEVRVSY
jgi:hypothetical protein